MVASLEVYCRDPTPKNKSGKQAFQEGHGTIISGTLTRDCQILFSIKKNIVQRLSVILDGKVSSPVMWIRLRATTVLYDHVTQSHLDLCIRNQHARSSLRVNLVNGLTLFREYFLQIKSAREQSNPLHRHWLLFLVLLRLRAEELNAIRLASGDIMAKVIFTPWKNRVHLLEVRDEFYPPPSYCGPDMRSQACAKVCPPCSTSPHPFSNGLGLI